MGEKTERNLAYAFAAESRASARNAAFALKADKENLPHIARLFRALSNAESVHANKYLLLMRGKLGSTRENLRKAVENETRATNDEYPRIIKDASDEGDSGGAEKAFTQSLEAEKSHERILKRVMDKTPTGPLPVCYVCQICGYISEDSAPENCPVCGAVQSRFRKIA